MGIVVRKARQSDSVQFMGLVESLAKFEHLDPPTSEGRKRLLNDVFKKRRLGLFLASQGRKLVGYALYFYTYSSFLAKQTLYLEDLFVLERYRGGGVGLALFRRCAEEAVSTGCGRMEWAVLDWNEKAQRFYEKLGARRMSEWHVYRLDESALKKLPHRRT